MLPWLIGAAVVAFAVVAFWDEIVSWLRDFIPKVKAAFREFKRNVLHAAAMFVQQVGAAAADIKHKVFYKENNQWMEQTTTRQIDKSELPPSIKRKLGFAEEEITEEMENELQMAI